MKINDIGSDRTDNSKGGDKEKFFVTKRGRKVSCEMGWIPSESGYLGTI